MRNRTIILLLFPLILLWVLTCKLFSISEESQPQRLLTKNLSRTAKRILKEPPTITKK